MNVEIGTVLYKLLTSIDGRAVGVERCEIVGEEGPGLDKYGNRIRGRWTCWKIVGETGKIYSEYTHHSLSGYYLKYEDAVSTGLEQLTHTLNRANKSQEKAKKAHEYFVKLTDELKVKYFPHIQKSFE